MFNFIYIVNFRNSLSQITSADQLTAKPLTMQYWEY
jgi:hypothetical protein